MRWTIDSIEDDIAAFGSALTEIQCINGRWFSPAQHGVFAPGPSAELVRLMRDRGAAGVGQSSGGPSVYGIVNDASAAASLAATVRSTLTEGDVYEGPFASHGAVVTAHLA